jgi:hypothetical protein
MVLTPVGYKCPEHARPKRSQYRFVKPKQLALAIVAGVVVGVGGAFLVAAITGGFFGYFIGLIWGSVTSEAVRRASGGHRGGTVGTVAAVCIGIGALLSGLSLIVAIIAIVTALVQLAVIEMR